MYKAPVEEIAHTLKSVTGLAPAPARGRFEDLTEDLLDAILAEAGRFASEEISPLMMIGDEKGVILKGADVTMPPGWRDLYARWREGGWNGLSGPLEYGGQGLPMTLNLATLEMWNGAAMPFGIGPILTQSAVEAVAAHAGEEIKAAYLEKLVSGEWMGTMNLTEPQAGSDLTTLATRAEPAGDGSYRLFGQKVFITYGDHDLSENIVHLVLARIVGAHAGARGISLFLVPKFLPAPDGSATLRNDVFCASAEHKLGLHASPTCTMIFGDGFVKDREPGAVGWLVGQENRGLIAMMTMMANARLAVGVQGVALAEAAYQHALAYAHERRQGKAASWKGEGFAPIVHHADVRRMLLTMKALIRAARAICYATAHAFDLAEAAEGEEARHWRDRGDLLTPLAKAFSTDVGVDVASLGVQVHGGMGFIEETGAAVYYRDARIGPIYEGTNGIQAIDLATRKVTLAKGAHVHGFIGELRAVIDQVRAAPVEGFGRTAQKCTAALDALERATDFLQKARTEARPGDALAGATPYLRLFALAAGGAYLARLALTGDASDVALCRFFAENLIDETAALASRVEEGADSLDAAGAVLGI